MSLRRPRIKSAVNLAALANGRRKAPSPEEKVADAPKEAGGADATEPEEHETVPKEAVEIVDTVATEISPGQAKKTETCESDDVVPANDVPAENSHSAEVADKHEEATGSNDTVAEIGEPRKDSVSGVGSDPKLLDNPFSPPPARPAPVARFKSRFRPNLNENRNRIRRYSGTLMDLVWLYL